ncbi:unnamed protein product (macronuclear) [Paramecium tetraurelia]|uniref:Nodulin-like domain-containing protein n=1 Tax=Paramecium tetraurelia TaxID=5888 RepID=A0DK19_PARTE|nr:uncharacterized protein GSPATT00017730001 [Paramecium tetraurelia]CAK83386.1 unnamed protein product [Paramecium tetraurelia]|eukprot:XP_001450783.1 hypothetical protein (macronuclear) [Paramecium tetraurelia strain d4-2]
MNESEFKKYKIDLKVREKSSATTLWLVIYICFIYLLFGSFNMCGKIFLTCAYIYSFSESISQLDYTSINLNIARWFLFQLVGPLSLPFIPYLIGKMKFRYILVAASLGPIIFLTPAPYACLCKDSQSPGCDKAFIYLCAILVSIIAGLMQSILLFTMLFYISNLSKSQEKVIYYGSFFFIHSLQWLLGSLIGEVFLTYDMNQDNSISKVFGLLILLQFVVSLLYLSIPEKSDGRYDKFHRTIFEYFNNKSQKQSKLEQTGGIRELLLKSTYINSDNDDESDTFKNAEETSRSQSKSAVDLHLFKSQMFQNSNTKSIMTLQCFSIEEQSLVELLESTNQQTKNSISIDEYQNRNYFQNIQLTFEKLCQEGFLSVLLLLCFIACIQAFLFIYFFPFFAYPGIKKLTFQARLVLQGYLYVGVGELFGSFGIGWLGDSKDQIKYPFIYNIQAPLSTFFKYSNSTTG